MYALTQASRRTRCAVETGPAARATRRSPQMRSGQRATHFFDAAWQSAQTLRRLIRAAPAGQAAAATGSAGMPAPLLDTMQTLLDSLCPGLPDDGDSRACFRQLLQLHLSGLSADETRQLSALLKQHRFDCVVSDAVVDDAMLKEFGFANGPPHCRQRTLLFTPDLHDALTMAAEAAASVEQGSLAGTAQALTPVQAQQARDVLATLAAGYAHERITLDGMTSAANRLAQAMGIATASDATVAATPLPPTSSVTWENRQLIVDLRMLSALMETGDRALHAEWMRDLLELLLAHKLFGSGVALASLSQQQRALLLRSVEQVLACAPGMHERTLPLRAARVLGGAPDFGTVQVFPAAGSLLGHAWIAPSLSVMPDKTRRATEIGKRYMRPGFRLTPASCSVNEWEIRWLSPTENDERYPATQTWQLPVPSPSQKLQAAAEQTRATWQRQGLRYRFIGTEPGMPPTGCRATVWHAVQAAMDDDARTLFEHFRQGLPDPESPTELALRIEQFMDWMAALAAPAGGRSPDL